MATRQQLIDEVRQYIGVKFAHQGRSRKAGMDCGGLILVAAQALGVTSLEFLGYADFPTDGRFEELLAEHTTLLWTRKYPFGFDGTELHAADLVSFDYGNSEGTRHLAMVTGWKRGRYRVIEAQPKYGVCEHPLALPFVTKKTTLKAWQIPKLDD